MQHNNNKIIITMITILLAVSMMHKNYQKKNYDKLVEQVKKDKTT
eukprot:UN01606